ncbi:hypothetical protein [Polyangium aurulentum]|uniref:hypothetical protein n=1 Tax=Polyangium aurulentum TaxID=2567896 RepID=UPI001F3E27CA|nr:hypothetical protein [Polyangium aurulentum]
MRKEKKPAPVETESGSPLKAAALALLLLGALGVGFRVCSTRRDVPESRAPASDAGDLEDAAPTKTAPEPRCTAASPEPFVVGEAPPPRARADRDAGADGGAIEGEAEEEFDELSPFAVELGRGAAYAGGFAVGALRDGEGGSLAMVATVGPDGRGGKLVRLGRSRGDYDAPTVTGHGASVLAAMLEPNAGGRAIRVAKVTGEAVAWGPELAEGRDESLAVDLAASTTSAIVVWDDVSKDGKRSMVMLASFDTETMRSIGEARPVSPPKQDAEAPRLAARPGGYWLAYAALGGASAPKDEDTGRVGEAINARWVEIVPLDEGGRAVSLPRAVTPKDGHALAFDLEPSEDGGVIVAWRDDDTPSGSSGGRVMSVGVRLSGLGEPRLLTEEGSATGVPDLMPGWLSLSSLSGATRIAPMTPRGEIAGELLPEPLLGNGEVLAATREGILVARPAGKAMKLSVMRCVAEPPDAGAAEAGAPPP